MGKCLSDFMRLTAVPLCTNFEYVLHTLYIYPSIGFAAECNNVLGGFYFSLFHLVATDQAG